MKKPKLSRGENNTERSKPYIPARPAGPVRRTIHWGSVVITDHQDLRRLLTEQRRLEKALEQRTRTLDMWLEVLQSVPACPFRWCSAHGGLCLPHTLGWILAHRQVDAERLRKPYPGTMLPGKGAVVPGALGWQIIRVRTDRPDAQDE